MTKRSAFNHETRDSARLPASSQRIIHLHQARPECGKILHESGVRKMLDTMEKTKKRYWHEELANCLGHVFDPQMLPDMERSDFCKRLGQQAIERVKGSDRLASGDMESNFSLNDTSRESSVQIYMDFMKTIAKHPDAQAVLASSEDVVRAIRSFPRGAAPGPTGLRPDLLQQLVSGSEERPAAHLLTQLVNLLADGQAPAGLRPYVGGGRGTALQKVSKTGTADVRPLCAGEALRRLVGKVLLRSELPALRAHLLPHQLAVGVSSGAEAMVHLHRQWVQRHSHDADRVCLSYDEGNAHNAVDRHCFLTRMREVVPGLGRWLE